MQTNKEIMLHFGTLVYFLCRSGLIYSVSFLKSCDNSYSTKQTTSSCSNIPGYTFLTNGTLFILSLFFKYNPKLFSVSETNE